MQILSHSSFGITYFFIEQPIRIDDSVLSFCERIYTIDQSVSKKMSVIIIDVVCIVTIVERIFVVLDIAIKTIH